MTGQSVPRSPMSTPRGSPSWRLPPLARFHRNPLATSTNHRNTSLVKLQHYTLIIVIDHNADSTSCNCCALQLISLYSIIFSWQHNYYCSINVREVKVTNFCIKNMPMICIVCTLYMYVCMCYIETKITLLTVNSITTMYMHMYMY